jgi:hypothetical protein
MTGFFLGGGGGGRDKKGKGVGLPDFSWYNIPKWEKYTK